MAHTLECVVGMLLVTKTTCTQNFNYQSTLPFTTMGNCMLIIESNHGLSRVLGYGIVLILSLQIPRFLESSGYLQLKIVHTKSSNVEK